MSIELPLESASLVQLQQTPIDKVLSSIDEGLVHLPSYRELYYRWERQQWRSQEIDFTYQESNNHEDSLHSQSNRSGWKKWTREDLGRTP